MIDPFINFQPQPFGDERLGGVNKQVVKACPVLAADLQHIAETAGDDQGRFSAFSFQQSIRGDR